MVDLIYNRSVYLTRPIGDAPADTVGSAYSDPNQRTLISGTLSANISLGRLGGGPMAKLMNDAPNDAYYEISFPLNTFKPGDVRVGDVVVDDTSPPPFKYLVISATWSPFSFSLACQQLEN